MERNCVGIPEIIPGDALTPGYSSISSKRVLDMEDIEGLAKIPAIPASWHELKPFLKTLKGLGVKNSESDNELWSGNLKDSPKARLRNFPVSLSLATLFGTCVPNWRGLEKIPGGNFWCAPGFMVLWCIIVGGWHSSNAGSSPRIHAHGGQA